MKTIFLWTKRKGWTKFEYESLDDIRNELDDRNIIVHPSAEIGNNAHISSNVIIGADTRIGDGIYIGKHASIWGATIIKNESSGDELGGLTDGPAGTI